MLMCSCMLLVEPVGVEVSHRVKKTDKMVAAGSCVAAPLEGSLLCNAAAAAESFASLEGMKSQAYHQHIETSPPRRHGGNPDFLQCQGHRTEEKSCFAASDASSVASAPTDNNAVSCSAIVASRISAGPSAEKAAAAAAPAASTASPTFAVVAPAYVVSSGASGPEDSDGSAPAKSSIDTCYDVPKGEAALHENVQQQQVTLTTTAVKLTPITSISSEVISCEATNISLPSHPSTSRVASSPSLNSIRSQSVCTSNSNNLSPWSSCGTTRRESNTYLDEDMNRDAEEIMRDNLAEEDAGNVKVFLHQAETHEETRSISSRVNNGEGNRESACTFNEDNGSNITNDIVKVTNGSTLSRNLSMTSSVADVSGRKEEEKAACNHTGVYPCAVDGSLIFAKPSACTTTVASSTGSDTSCVIASAIAAGALDVNTTYHQEFNAETVQSESTCRIYASAFVETSAGTKSSVAAAGGSQDRGASSSTTVAATTAVGDDNSADATVEVCVAAVVCSSGLTWKGEEAEVFCCSDKEQRYEEEEEKMRKQEDLDESSMGQDFFSLLSSDIAVDERRNARQQQQGQQNGNDVSTQTQREQQEACMLVEKKKKKEEEKCFLRCDPQLECLLQRHNKQQEEMERNSEKTCNSACSSSLHIHEKFHAEEEQKASTTSTTIGERICVLQQQQRQNTFHLDLMWEEEIVDDSYLHGEMHAQDNRKNEDEMEVSGVDNTPGQEQEHREVCDHHHHHQDMKDVSNNSIIIMKTDVQQQHQQQERKCHYRCTESVFPAAQVDNNTENGDRRKSSDSIVLPVAPAPTHVEMMTSRCHDQPKNEGEVLLHVNPEENKGDNCFDASLKSWEVSLWGKEETSTSKEEMIKQEKKKQEQEHQAQDDGEAEDVMMTSLASQTSITQENNTSILEEKNSTVMNDAQQEYTDEQTFSFDVWQQHPVIAHDTRQGRNNISSDSTRRRRSSHTHSHSHSHSSTNKKIDIRPCKIVTSSISSSCVEAMQSQCVLMGSETHTSTEREQQESSSVVVMDSVSTGNNVVDTSEGRRTCLQKEECNAKEETAVMEEDMFVCHTSSSSGASGSIECEGGTGVSSVAETATVNAAAEPRLSDSSGGEEGDEETHHHTLFDTCLTSSVENITEISSPPPPSSFTLWAEHEQHLASSCAGNAASADTTPNACCGADVHLHNSSETRNSPAAAIAVAAASAGDHESIAARARALDTSEEDDDVADSVLSTNCSFFFSNLTETACEEDKSTRGCCAVVAGTASGESMGLCSSSDEDEDESGPEDETSTDVYESGCGRSEWSSHSFIEETITTTTGEEEGGCDAVEGRITGRECEKDALIQAYPPHRFLKKKNVLCSSDPFQHEETVFIFDWDDTLLPSSWLSQKGLTLDSSSVEIDLWRKKLSAAAAHAEQTLYAARALGRVVIVTNAETGWIDLSCSKFMPDLAPLLRCFRIVSARSVYESSCCNTPFLWKVAAFTEELRRHFPGDTQRRWNVISVGDSTHEREALFSVCGRLGQFYNVTTKSLKLLEAPAVEDLHSQHELMLECLETVAKHKGNLDLCVASVLEAALEKGDYAGTPLPAGLERCTVGLHCLRYHPLAPEVVGRA